MYWWKITDLKLGKSFNNIELPLKFIPCLAEININEGHLPTHSEIRVEVFDNLCIDLHTGAFWADGHPVDFIINPERIILYKRTIKSLKEGTSHSIYFLGMIDKFKNGKVFKIINGNEFTIEEYKIQGVAV